MFKKVFGFCIALLCSFSVTACEYLDFPQDVSEVSQIKEISIPEVSEISKEESEEVSIETDEEVFQEESTVSEAEVSEETSVAGTGRDEETIVIGETENGFTITQTNGIYYIDGILIVNKTYPLPADYPVKGLTPETLSALIKMQNGAKEDGINIKSRSDFRSYENQAYLYNTYCNRDGKEQADRYSARPGHSEHQSGMAIDINMANPAFTDTDEAIWLKNHCAEYGFIIRYPEGKEEITGYIYESWHVRYVGKELAEKLYLGDGEFTTLEEYFGITSAYAD